MPGFVPSYGEGTMGELVLQVLRDAGDGGLTVTELIEACDRAGRKFKNAMAAQSGARLTEWWSGALTAAPIVVHAAI